MSSSFDQEFREREDVRGRREQKDEAIAASARGRLSELVTNFETSVQQALQKLEMRDIQILPDSPEWKQGAFWTVVRATCRTEKLDFKLRVEFYWIPGDGINLGLGHVGQLTGKVRTRGQNREAKFGGAFRDSVAVSTNCGIDAEHLRRMITTAINEL